MASYLHGVHTPHRKKTRHKPVLRMNVPQTVTIPMSMHIGAPSVPIVKVGDEVIVMGSDGVNSITADDIAHATGTINYEITCAFGQRLPKVFVR